LEVASSSRWSTNFNMTLIARVLTKHLKDFGRSLRLSNQLCVNETGVLALSVNFTLKRETFWV
jgi:hypothetical protein